MTAVLRLASRHRLYAWIVLSCAPLTAVVIRTGEYLWTDIAEIQDRGLIRTTWASLLQSMTDGIDGHYYRPLVILAHSATFMTFGDRPGIFRLTNLLLHIVNALLVFRLARAVRVRRHEATVAAGLFGIHPLSVTPIAWASDRTDLLALLCGLLASIALVEYVRTGRRRCVVAMAVALAIGLSAKEAAAALLCLSLLVWLISSGKARQRLVTSILVQGVVTATWFAWRTKVTTVEARRENVLSMADTLSLASFIHHDYGVQLIAPFRLAVCDGVVAPSPGWPWILLGAISVCAIVSLCLWAYRTRRWPLLFACLWAIAFLAPTSGLIPLKHVRADRYLYMAMPGLALLGASPIVAAVGRTPSRYARGCLYALVYGYLATCGIYRTAHFTSDRSLWEHEVAENKACLEGHAYLGHSAFAEKDYPRALGHLKHVIEFRPAGLVAYAPVARCHIDYGLVLGALGLIHPAKQALTQVYHDASDADLKCDAAYALALVALQAGDFSGAEGWLTHISGKVTRGRLPETYLLRSYARMKLARWNDSRDDLVHYVRESPVRSAPHDRLIGEITAAIAQH